jgi:hypothetical protein
MEYTPTTGSLGWGLTRAAGADRGRTDAYRHSETRHVLILSVLLSIRTFDSFPDRDNSLSRAQQEDCLGRLNLPIPWMFRAVRVRHQYAPPSERVIYNGGRELTLRDKFDSHENHT